MIKQNAADSSRKQADIYFSASLGVKCKYSLSVGTSN